MERTVRPLSNSISLLRRHTTSFRCRSHHEMVNHLMVRATRSEPNVLKTHQEDLSRNTIPTLNKVWGFALFLS
jgi:hypothetical protein